jgi:uroporphyrinogen-III synthase
MPVATALRVLVTRPAREAARWVPDLRARGLDAVPLPLITIVQPLDPGPLRTAWRQLGGYTAVMFVSGNAVAHFFACSDPSILADWAQGALPTRAWSPGPGTSAALQQAGLPAARIDAPAVDAAQFDSEALWARVRGQLCPGQRVLIVRGGDGDGRSVGRDWLAAQLASAGVAVDRVVAYRRIAPQLEPAQQALARRAATDGSVWLFSSSEAVANLQLAVPAQDWSRARALVTHPRIGQAAVRAGFGVVRASRPAFADVVASIESFS